MGYTEFSKSLVEKYITNPFQSVEDLGSQNDYTTGQQNPPFISEWYKSKGITDYTCIDLAGDNNALKMDWAYPLNIGRQFSIVCDMGSSEHTVQMDGYEKVAFHDGYINSIYPTEIKDALLGYYHCWKNKFELCEIGGLIISENPLQNNWPGHGYHYISEMFYRELMNFADLEILELGTHAASGNFLDGFNVYCVLKKTGRAFPIFEDFKQFDIKPS